jgi:hypothetical protein
MIKFIRKHNKLISIVIAALTVVLTMIGLLIYDSVDNSGSVTVSGNKGPTVAIGNNSKFRDIEVNVGKDPKNIARENIVSAYESCLTINIGLERRKPESLRSYSLSGPESIIKPSDFQMIFGSDKYQKVNFYFDEQVQAALLALKGQATSNEELNKIVNNKHKKIMEEINMNKIMNEVGRNMYNDKYSLDYDGIPPEDPKELLGFLLNQLVHIHKKYCEFFNLNPA